MSGKEFSNRNNLKSMVFDFARAQYLPGGPLDRFVLIIKRMLFGSPQKQCHFTVVSSVLLSLLTKEGEENYSIKLQTVLQTS